MKRRRPPLTVGVFADLPGGLGGGVSFYTRALVESLIARLPDGVRLVAFVARGDADWRRAVHERVAFVEVERWEVLRGLKKWRDRGDRSVLAFTRTFRGDVLGGRMAVRHGGRERRILDAVHRSPWPLDVMHFPFQTFTPLPIPTILGLWDLQHVHLRDLWPRGAAADRDRYYLWSSRLATRVLLASESAREDVIRQYGLLRSSTAVIPVASPRGLSPPPSAYDVEQVRRKYELPDRFAFYPAITWRHKNHIRLLSALAEVRRRGAGGLHLVCSGQRGQAFDEIVAHARAVGVVDNAHFLGHVADMEIRALYRLAEFCIIPSLFEGAGLPVLEAFDEGCPLAVSRVASIPEYAADAALYFDPTDEGDIADAMVALAVSAQLRCEMAKRGRARGATFTWDRVVESLLDLCGSVAGVPVQADVEEGSFRKDGDRVGEPESSILNQDRLDRKP